MNLLNLLKARRNEAARDRNRNRRVLLGPEDLEARKVLSTLGSFEGMAWSYSENASTRTGTLDFTSKPGTAKIQIQSLQENLSPGDHGYNPNSNPVIGVSWTYNDDSGGVNITPGYHVNITVEENAKDDQFLNNDKADFSMTTVARPVTTSGSPTGGSTNTTPPTPATAQTGTTLGLTWRFAPDATGGGTMYVQDVAKGTDPADSHNDWIAVNESGGRMVLDTDASSPYFGPTFVAGSKVKVVVAETAGDIHVYDDRDGGTGGLTTKARVQTGTISVPNGSLAWTFTQDIVKQTGSFSVASGANDRSTYWITTEHQDLSPGDPGYVANSNPVVGLEVSDSGSDQGGVSFDPGMSIAVATSGGATFKRASV